MREEDIKFIKMLITELDKAEAMDYRNFIAITLEARDAIVEGLKDIIIANV